MRGSSTLKIKCEPAACPENKQNLSSASSSEKTISQTPRTTLLASRTSSSLPSKAIPPNMEFETSSCMLSSTELPSSFDSRASDSADSTCFVTTSDSDFEGLSGMVSQINPALNFNEMQPASIPALNRVKKRVRGVRFHTAEAFGVITGGGNWRGEFGKPE